MKRVLIGFLVHLSALCIYTSVAAQWNLHLVDNVGTAGYNSRIAVTSDGTPYIFYGSAAGDWRVRLAWWVSAGDSTGGWTDTLVANTPGYAQGVQSRGLAMRADSNDDLHLAWAETGGVGRRIVYAVFDAATKSLQLAPEEVASHSFSCTSFTLDLALVDTMGTITPTLVYSTCDTMAYATRDAMSGIWSGGHIYESKSMYPSVVAESTGTLHASFYEPVGQDLMYAKKLPTDSFWTTSYVDVAGLVGSYSSIVIDDTGTPFIAYYDQTNGDLKYARLVP